jgi:hypothetical protein
MKSLLIIIVCIQILFAQGPDNSQYSNGLVGCTNGQNNGQYICYNGGSVSLPKYCTVTCASGQTLNYIFSPSQLSSSWMVYVTVQGAFQSSGGSWTGAVGPCTRLSNYINNPIAWGGGYLTTAVPFIQSVTNNAPGICGTVTPPPPPPPPATPTVPENSAYTNGLVGCTNGQSSSQFICYSGGSVSLPKYCTMTCGGSQSFYVFNPTQLSSSWMVYVTVQGAFQSSGGSSTGVIGPCSRLSNYINNPIAWGGGYLTTAVPFIQSVTAAVSGGGCALSVEEENTLQVRPILPRSNTFSGNTLQRILPKRSLSNNQVLSNEVLDELFNNQ